MSLNQWYVYRLRGHAAAMVIITLAARLLGMSNGVAAPYGIVPDMLFNVVAGTLILHLIDRAKPKVYV
jgi:hypothetical protein